LYICLNFSLYELFIFAIWRRYFTFPLLRDLFIKMLSGTSSPIITLLMNAVDFVYLRYSGYGFSGEGISAANSYPTRLKYLQKPSAIVLGSFVVIPLSLKVSLMLLFLILRPISEFRVFHVSRTLVLYRNNISLKYSVLLFRFNLLKVFLYSRYVLRILSLLG